jgi:FkbM family methyltransferase
LSGREKQDTIVTETQKVNPMRGQAAALAKMFLDYRSHRGARDFWFRPHFRRKKGLTVINLTAKDGPFNADIFLRPNTTDLATFEEVFLDGSYNLRRIGHRFDEMVALYRLLPKPLIVDLGANIGLSSLYLQKCWPRARVIAVEPQLDNFNMLLLNAPKAIPLRAAATSELCRMAITNPDAPAWSYRTTKSESGTIDGITVDQIIELNPEHDPFICKIDIEGYERELFSKNTDWLSRFTIIVIELHDRFFRGTARNFLAAAAASNRDFIFSNENLWSIVNTNHNG